MTALLWAAAPGIISGVILVGISTDWLSGVPITPTTENPVIVVISITQ